jgi:hypothetical protein
MAIARDTTAANIKPLEGAIIRRFTAGAAIAAGELVSIMADGNVDPSDSDAFTGANCVGVALAAAASAGDLVDVVTYGPVKCITGGTPAALVYTNTSPGEPSESAGTKSTVAGFVESATVLFVRPWLVDLS